MNTKTIIESADYQSAKKCLINNLEKVKAGSAFQRIAFAVMQTRRKYPRIYYRIHIDDEHTWKRGWSSDDYRVNMNDVLMFDYTELVQRKIYMGRFRKAQTYTAEKCIMVFFNTDCYDTDAN